MRDRAAGRVHLVTNPYGRVVGKDTDMLNKQIAEKNASEARKKAEAAAEAKRQQDIQRMMDMDAQKQDEQKIAQQEEMRAMWRDQAQQKRARDAAFMKSEASLKRNSGMKFDGEDRYSAERHRMQQLQNKRWLEQQQADKSRKREKQRLRDEKDQSIFLAQQRKMAEMDQLNSDDRQEREYQQQQFNLEMVRDQKRRQQMNRDLENREKARANEGVLNFWDSDRLATVGETSCLGSHRVRTDHWRGMNAAQRKAIAAENQRVAADNKARREQEARDKVVYQKQLAMQHRAMAMAEHRAAATRKVEASQLLASQMQHASEAAASKAQEKRTRGNVKVGSEFFGCFGTSAR